MTNLLRLNILKTSNKKYGVKRGSYEIIRILLFKIFLCYLCSVHSSVGLESCYNRYQNYFIKTFAILFYFLSNDGYHC